MLLGARQFFERRGTPTPPLPYDAEVEYLESTGTQYIDTGYSFNSATDKVELVFELLTTTPNYKWIFGAYDTKRFAIGSGDNADRRTFGYNASTSYNSSTYYTNGAHIFLADSTGASIDGHNFFGFADFSTTSHIILYSIPINTSTFCSNSRIWSYKHYRNGVLIRDFIPVRVGGVGYIYDRVSGNLLGNSGTGAFTIGPDKTAWQNPYVTDGLVAMWDGEWNAGGGVHDPNATVWTNLAGTSTLPDLSISEGLSFSHDSLVFPYGAAYRNSRASASTGYAPSVYGYTLEIVIKNASANDFNRNALIFGCNEYKISTISRSSAGGQYSFGYNREGIYSPDTSYLASTWANNTATMYSNGAVGTPSTYKGSFGVTGISGVCAINPRGDFPFVGEVCALRLHSRALTAAEIAANYAIDKARFSLL